MINSSGRGVRMPEDYRDIASQKEFDSFEFFESLESFLVSDGKQSDKSTFHNILDVVVEKIPFLLVAILKRPEEEWRSFEKYFIKYAEDTGILPITVWWYPSSWALRRNCYWKYLVAHKKFSQLELLIEDRLKRHKGIAQ